MFNTQTKFILSRSPDYILFSRFSSFSRVPHCRQDMRKRYANGLEHIICCICNSQIIPSAGGVISLSLGDIKTFSYWFFFVSRICFIFNLSFNFRCIEPTTFDQLNRSTCCLIWTNTLLCDIKLALSIYKQLIAIDES